MEISPNQFFIGLSGTNGRAQDRLSSTPAHPNVQSNGVKQAQQDAYKGQADDIDVIKLFDAQQHYLSQTQNPKTRPFAEVAANTQRSAVFIDTYA